MWCISHENGVRCHGPISETRKLQSETAARGPRWDLGSALPPTPKPPLLFTALCCFLFQHHRNRQATATLHAVTCGQCHQTSLARNRPENTVGTSLPSLQVQLKLKLGGPLEKSVASGEFHWNGNLRQRKADAQEMEMEQPWTS